MSCPCEAAEVVNDLPCGSPAILMKLACLTSKRAYRGLYNMHFLTMYAVRVDATREMLLGHTSCA
jgi:hypothetical protein